MGPGRLSLSCERGGGEKVQLVGCPTSVLLGTGRDSGPQGGRAGEPRSRRVRSRTQRGRGAFPGREQKVRSSR